MTAKNEKELREQVQKIRDANLQTYNDLMKTVGDTRYRDSDRRVAAEIAIGFHHNVVLLDDVLAGFDEVFNPASPTQSIIDSLTK